METVPLCADTSCCGVSSAVSAEGAASCVRWARAAMLPRMALAAGPFSSVGAGAAFSDSRGVNATSKVSPVRIGLVKSA